MTLLSFLFGSFPTLLHSKETLFVFAFTILDSLLHRTASEHTQAQCFIVLRLHIGVLTDLCIGVFLTSFHFDIFVLS